MQCVMHRPNTRGELRRNLQEGITCEVAGHVAEMTAIMLSGWGRFGSFRVSRSPNQGWVLFEPTTPDEPPYDGTWPL